ncbi:MAG: T9SS type A sorting domain-containing protein [Bacteroidetes bacterium]|nr:T9SS type A sorting domain-containing protein [Bacteroidota bacterium]
MKTIFPILVSLLVSTLGLGQNAEFLQKSLIDYANKQNLSNGTYKLSAIDPGTFLLKQVHFIQDESGTSSSDSFFYDSMGRLVKQILTKRSLYPKVIYEWEYDESGRDIVYGVTYYINDEVSGQLKVSYKGRLRTNFLDNGKEQWAEALVKDWEPWFHRIINYGPGGHQLNLTEFEMINGSWITTAADSSAFDEQNRVLWDKFSRFNGAGKEISYIKTEYVYTQKENGLTLTREVKENGNESSFFRVIDEFNLSTHLVRTQYQTRENQTQDWHTNYEYHYENDSFGRPLVSVYLIPGIDSTMVNSMKTIKKYLSNGFTFFREDYRWESGTGWNLQNQRIFSVNETEEILTEESLSFPDLTKHDYKTSYTYDANLNLEFVVPAYYDNGEWTQSISNFSFNYDKGSKSMWGKGLYAKLEWEPFIPTTVTSYSNSNLQSPKLLQNYPNPFNPETQIRFYLPEAGKVTLSVLDVTGRTVAVLAKNSGFQAGEQSLSFSGAGLSTGLYFTRLEVGGKMLTSKIMLVK